MQSMMSCMPYLGFTAVTLIGCTCVEIHLANSLFSFVARCLLVLPGIDFTSRFYNLTRSTQWFVASNQCCIWAHVLTHPRIWTRALNAKIFREISPGFIPYSPCSATIYLWTLVPPRFAVKIPHLVPNLLWCDPFWLFCKRNALRSYGYRYWFQCADQQLRFH